MQSIESISFKIHENLFLSFFSWLQNTCHYFWRWLYTLSIFIDAFCQGFTCTPLLKFRFDETISNGVNTWFIYYDLCFTTKYKWSNIGDIVYPLDLTKKTAHSRTHFAHIGWWYLNFTHKFFIPYTIEMAQFWIDTLFQSQN